MKLRKSDRVEIVRRARANNWSLLAVTARTGITKPERYITSERRTA